MTCVIQGILPSHYLCNVNLCNYGFMCLKVLHLSVLSLNHALRTSYPIEVQLGAPKLKSKYTYTINHALKALYPTKVQLGALKLKNRYTKAYYSCLNNSRPYKGSTESS